MVLMRRKDKRRGNKDEEIAVASDSSIIANKGVRSMQSARTGRFAADMRVHVGGYGRADKTWGVDHPWHTTREDMFHDLSARDRMEEGYLAKEDEETEKKAQGLSRAALKKKKAKMKKGGLAGSMASSEAGSEAVTGTSVASAAAIAVEKKDEKKPMEGSDSPLLKKKVKKVEEQKEEKEEDADEKHDGDDATDGKGKKRKRVNRNKKKQEKARAAQASNADEDDNESDLDESVEVAAKAKKQKAAQQEQQPTEVVSKGVDKKQIENDNKTREAIAKQYESAAGHEFTTASGLTMRDVRVGQGRVPSMGEMLTVRYRGRIGDKNGIVFGKGMLTTNYGTGSVIAGWEEGMGTMRSGGIRHLVVPPNLGYGAGGRGGKIPPNATLFFEVELVRIGKRKRDAVGKDEIPLPSSFQRKRIKQPSSTDKDTKSSGKSKRRRRKHSI